MKIGFLGVDKAYIEDGYLATSESIMASSGQNTGNLAFWSGFTKLLPTISKRVFWDDNAIKLKNEIDVLVIAAANFLREDSDLTQLSKLVKELDKPVVIAGLGAESQHEDKIPNLPDGTVDFLCEVSKRTEYIGVRGEFTKSVCEYYGVKNVKVLGCPSIFINNDVDLGKKIEKKWNAPLNRFSTASASIKDNLKGSEKRLFKEVSNRHGTYILQRPAALFKCALSEKLDSNDMKYVSKYSKYIGLPNCDLKEYLSLRANVFTSATSWLDNIRHSTHTVNTRIHGTIFPIMAGVPSICVTHDTRTRELCNALKIRSIPARVFEESALSIEELFYKLKFDGTEFDNNRLILAKEYINLFNSMNISPSEYLISFSECRR